MKLTAKLMLVFLVAVLLLTTVYAWFVVRRDSRAFRQENHDRSVQVATAMRTSVTLAWRDNGRDAAIQVIEQSFTRSTDQDVRLVSLGRPSEIDMPMAPMEELRGLSPGETKMVEHRDEKGDLHMLTYFPFHESGGDTWALEFNNSMGPLEDEHVGTVYRTAVLVTAFVITCVVIVFFVGVRIVGRPLEQLIDKTRRVGEGDFSRPIQLKRKDELGQLATAVNKMCEQLSDQQRQIQASADAKVEALQQLRHGDRLRTVGRLAAGIAHELGTPLNVVAGRAELIAGGELNKAEIAKSANAIQSECRRMTDLIQRLLDFSRRKAAQKSSVDLSQLVSQTYELLDTLAKKKDVNLELTCPTSPVPVKVDQAQLQQVLTNVTMNAVQSMLNGGEVRIDVATVDEPRAMARVSVADRGVGMSAETMDQIFEPFFTTKEPGEGTGLGLSIAQTIIEEHEGRIEVESVEGVGTTVSIYLPLETNA